MNDKIDLNLDDWSLINVICPGIGHCIVRSNFCTKLTDKYAFFYKNGIKCQGLLIQRGGFLNVIETAEERNIEVLFEYHDLNDYNHSLKSFIWNRIFSKEELVKKLKESWSENSENNRFNNENIDQSSNASAEVVSILSSEEDVDNDCEGFDYEDENDDNVNDESSDLYRHPTNNIDLLGLPGETVYKYANRLAHTLWTRDELAKHVIPPQGILPSDYRQEIVDKFGRRYFSSREDLAKIARIKACIKRRFSSISTPSLANNNFDQSPKMTVSKKASSSGGWFIARKCINRIGQSRKQVVEQQQSFRNNGELMAEDFDFDPSKSQFNTSKLN